MDMHSKGLKPDRSVYLPALRQHGGFVRWVSRQLRSYAKPMLVACGYDDRNWLRIVQIRAWERFLRDRAGRGPVLEISPAWSSCWAHIAGNRYRSLSYPDFDITQQASAQEFDVVILDQVLEHVVDPLGALRNVRAMVREGGHALIATPFLFRVHERPGDYWRWTEDGLRLLLIEAGFDADRIETGSWGNARCARAHLNGSIKPMGFGRDLANDPALPIMVWAFAGA